MQRGFSYLMCYFLGGSKLFFFSPFTFVPFNNLGFSLPCFLALVALQLPKCFYFILFITCNIVQIQKQYCFHTAAHSEKLYSGVNDLMPFITVQALLSHHFIIQFQRDQWCFSSLILFSLNLGTSKMLHLSKHIIRPMQVMWDFFFLITLVSRPACAHHN